MSSPEWSAHDPAPIAGCSFLAPLLRRSVGEVLTNLGQHGYNCIRESSNRLGNRLPSALLGREGEMRLLHDGSGAGGRTVERPCIRVRLFMQARSLAELTLWRDAT